MKKKFKTNLSTIKNIVLSVVIMVCLALDAWACYIHIWGEDKVNSYIFKVGQQTATAINPTTSEETTEDRWFCEVNIYDNCYEILFNYFTDETKSEFYSQGLQFHLTDTTTDLKTALGKNYTYSGNELSLFYKNQSLSKAQNSYTKTLEEWSSKLFGWKYAGRYEHHTQYYNILTDKYYNGIEVSNFASSNKYEDTIYSANPLDENSYFYIDMGEEKPYLMQMRGSDYKFLSQNSKDFFITETSTWTHKVENGLKTIKTNYYDDVSYYRSCDIYYFAELVYNSCLGFDYTNSDVVINFEFDNLFNYYDTDGIEIVNESLCDKIKQHVKSYYQIKVERHQGNMTKASQSLFKNFNGSTNYDEESAEDSESAEIFTDYHHGRTILDVDENFFKVNLIYDNSTGKYKMYLSLDRNFVNKYPASNGYRLRVKINLDNLNYSNIEFAGLVKGTLDDYYVYQVLTTQTIDGEIITTDITQGVA